MYFSSGLDVTLWFKGLASNGPWGYLGLLLLVFSVGLLQECLTTYRVVCMKRASMRANVRLVNGAPNSSQELDINDVGLGFVLHQKFKVTVKDRLAVTALYGVNITLAYLLMLAAMTYNAGVFVATVLGISTGYFLCYRGPLVEFQNGEGATGAGDCCPT